MTKPQCGIGPRERGEPACRAAGVDVGPGLREMHGLDRRALSRDRVVAEGQKTHGGPLLVNLDGMSPDEATRLPVAKASGNGQ